MQMRGLLAFDKPIFRTCDDGYRHPQQPVLFLESACRRKIGRVRESESGWQSVNTWIVGTIGSERGLPMEFSVHTAVP